MDGPAAASAPASPQVVHPTCTSSGYRQFTWEPPVVTGNKAVSYKVYDGTTYPGTLIATQSYPGYSQYVSGAWPTTGKSFSVSASNRLGESYDVYAGHLYVCGAQKPTVADVQADLDGLA